VCCSVLQLAVCYSVLQYVAVCRSSNLLSAHLACMHAHVCDMWCVSDTRSFQGCQVHIDTLSCVLSIILFFHFPLPSIFFLLFLCPVCLCLCLWNLSLSPTLSSKLLSLSIVVSICMSFSLICAFTVAFAVAFAVALAFAILIGLFLPLSLLFSPSRCRSCCRFPSRSFFLSLLSRWCACSDRHTDTSMHMHAHSHTRSLSRSRSIFLSLLSRLRAR